MKGKLKQGQRRGTVPLAQWCEEAGISVANAHGYYLPKRRIPGAYFDDDSRQWFVPRKSQLIRKQSGGKRVPNLEAVMRDYEKSKRRA